MAMPRLTVEERLSRVEDRVIRGWNKLPNKVRVGSIAALVVTGVATVLFALANLAAAGIGLARYSDDPSTKLAIEAEEEYVKKLDDLRLSASLAVDIDQVLVTSSHDIQYGYVRSQTSGYWVCALHEFQDPRVDALPLTWAVPTRGDEWVCADLDSKKKRMADVDPDRVTRVK